MDAWEGYTKQCAITTLAPVHPSRDMVGTLPESISRKMFLCRVVHKIGHSKKRTKKALVVTTTALFLVDMKTKNISRAVKLEDIIKVTIEHLLTNNKARAMSGMALTEQLYFEMRDKNEPAQLLNLVRNKRNSPPPAGLTEGEFVIRVINAARKGIVKSNLAVEDRREKEPSKFETFRNLKKRDGYIPPKEKIHRWQYSAPFGTPVNNSDPPPPPPPPAVVSVSRKESSSSGRQPDIMGQTHGGTSFGMVLPDGQQRDEIIESLRNESNKLHEEVEEARREAEEARRLAEEAQLDDSSILESLKQEKRRSQSLEKQLRRLSKRSARNSFSPVEKATPPLAAVGSHNSFDWFKLPTPVLAPTSPALLNLDLTPKTSPDKKPFADPVSDPPPPAPPELDTKAIDSLFGLRRQTVRKQTENSFAEQELTLREQKAADRAKKIEERERQQQTDLAQAKLTRSSAAQTNRDWKPKNEVRFQTLEQQPQQQPQQQQQQRPTRTSFSVASASDETTNPQVTKADVWAERKQFSSPAPSPHIPNNDYDPIMIKASPLTRSPVRSMPPVLQGEDSPIWANGGVSFKKPPEAVVTPVVTPPRQIPVRVSPQPRQVADTPTRSPPRRTRTISFDRLPPPTPENNPLSTPTHIPPRGGTRVYYYDDSDNESEVDLDSIEVLPHPQGQEQQKRKKKRYWRGFVDEWAEMCATFGTNDIVHDPNAVEVFQRRLEARAASQENGLMY